MNLPPNVRRRLREDIDDKKEGKMNEMSGVTRWEVWYKRASTNLYRWVKHLVITYLKNN